MRDKDVLTAAYLKNNSRFADLLNGWLFGGRPVVRPEDIQELDSAEIRIRRQEHRERKDLKAEEYLSGISREDRFLPVVTLVLYFGKHWDGPRNLKDLLDLEGMLPEVRELLADYPVHVIEVGNYPYAEAFRTDLKLVFGFVQNADDKEKLRAFARAEEEALSELAEDAYDLISVMTGTEELDRIKKEKQERKGKVNMCKAIDDMLADAREEGRERGRSEMMNGMQEMIADAREEGREAGRSETMNGLQEMITDVREEERKETIQTFVNDYIEEGFSREILIKKLQKMFSLDQKTALEYVK